MEVAIVSDTSGLLWFHTFAVFLHLNLYSETKKKKDQLFSIQKKRKCNDYNIREKQTIK